MTKVTGFLPRTGILIAVRRASGTCLADLHLTLAGTRVLSPLRKFKFFSKETLKGCATETGELYEFGPFRLDVSQRRLLRSGQAVPLTPKVFQLLRLLVERGGNVIEKKELMESLWPDTFVEEGNLAQHVSVLRKALGENGDRAGYIETVPKYGYRFVAAIRKCSNNGAMSGTPRLAITEHRRYSRTWAPNLAGALLLAGIAAFRLLDSEWPTDKAVRVTPLTSYPGVELFPTFSPDGAEVAFIWVGQPSRTVDLYVKPVAASDVRRLTTDAEPECYPCWSPDGQFIAFLHCAPGTLYGFRDSKADVLLVPLFGGPKRKLGEISIADTVHYPALAWTADSKWLLMSDAGSISLLSVETGAKRRLTTPPRGSHGGDFAPAVSPDGKKLVFVRGESQGSAELYAVDLEITIMDNSVPRPLTSENAFVTNPFWMPDGKDVLFILLRDGGRALWRVPAAGKGAPHPVASLGQLGIHLAMSRQGDRIAYSDTYPDRDIWQFELTGRAEAHPVPKRLVSSTRFDGNPQFSPDGKKIAFASERSGSMEIWVCDSDGSRPVQLTKMGATAGTPRWSPDGSAIAFDAAIGRDQEIYVMPATAGEPTLITRSPASDVVPSWSRDGHWIYFTSNRSGTSQIWKVSARGGHPLAITQEGGFGGFESTDGEFLYYAKNHGGPTSIWRVPSEGGPEREIIGSLFSWAHFAVIGEGIYFVPTPTSHDHFAVRFYDARRDEVRSMATVQGRPGFGFSISPDRTSILYSPSEYRGGDLILVERPDRRSLP